MLELTLDGDIKEFSDDIGDCNNDFGSLSDDIGSIDDDFGSLSDDIGSMDDDIGSLSDDLGCLSDDFGYLAGDIGNLHDDSIRSAECGSKEKGGIVSEFMGNCVEEWLPTTCQLETGCGAGWIVWA